MAKWYVKDLSNLTGVSVQTLHHYDRIDLLKPSLRQPNGYRIYAENDLLRLQQIVALKYFGFDLNQIKALLADDVSVRENFETQARYLRQKAETMMRASQQLEHLIAENVRDNSIEWKKLIEMIEVYRMTQQLENSWASEVFTSDELKQYAEFESGLKSRFTPEDKAAFDKAWTDVVEDIKQNLDKDPTSEIGLELAERVMTLVNHLYGEEHANLKHQIWEEGFKKGKMEDNHSLTPEMVDWLAKANDAYYYARIYTILDQVGEGDDKAVETQWNALLDEMYGNAQTLKDDLVEAALKDERVSDRAKAWLKH